MTASSADTRADSPPKQNETSIQKHEEYQYLDLVREILEEGEHRPDRYGHIFRNSLDGLAVQKAATDSVVGQAQAPTPSSPPNH